jgi:diacylglycerol kinase family enzyme
VRAVLIANPSATTAAGWSRDIIMRTLAAELDLTTAMTEYRGHAIDLAAAARRDGADVVITLGGDGTVNEAINGLLRDGVGDSAADALPMLATIPAGLANVFPRALGFNQNAMTATGEILQSLATRHTRSISLGRVNERWFAFNAGFGFDAGIIEAMESQRAEGHRASPARYITTLLRQYLEEHDWNTPKLTVTASDGRVASDVFMVIAQNTTPYVFVGPLPLDFSTGASFERGIDIIALTDMSPLSLATYLAEAAAGVPTEKRANVTLFEDCENVTITATDHIPVQVDGDSIGSFSSVELTSFMNVLEVVTPPGA